MGGKEDRERLKEEYKQHYRALNEARKKAAESERMVKIAAALDRMNASHLLEKFDSMLHTVREKIEYAEAKLDMALEANKSALDDAELEEVTRKQKASDALMQIRNEMGLLHDEIDSHLERVSEAGKTLGPAGDETKKRDVNPSQASEKTLGPKARI